MFARLVLLFIAVATLALGWMLWLTAHAGRERDPVLRAWHRLGKRYARIGLGRVPHEPASDWAVRVAASRPDLGEPLQRLIRGFNNWRYAGQQEPRPVASALVLALRRHRPARKTRRPT